MTKETLLGDDVFVIRGFLKDVECGALIEASEQRSYEDATIETGTGPVFFSEFRNNKRVMVDEARLAAKLFARVREHVPQGIGARRASGLNERFRFYRYDPGQAFAPHFDGPFRRNEWEESALTLMIYLNDDFTGGTTDFYHVDGSLRLRVKPETGMALVFRHQLLHAGTPVGEGRKYVLRTDVMYSTPNFRL